MGHGNLSKPSMKGRRTNDGRPGSDDAGEPEDPSMKGRRTNDGRFCGRCSPQP
ncbi:hypothetical protein HMPREF0290_1274 [Corynebacterium efficiens YS-314]|nr:hypothetical protein HMPREF0290_1274 [Corynebacterium efficiens YS-314]